MMEASTRNVQIFPNIHDGKPFLIRFKVLGGLFLNSISPRHSILVTVRTRERQKDWRCDANHAQSHELRLNRAHKGGIYENHRR